jgi:RimJ/RimL family protein N-acetyltransferase
VRTPTPPDPPDPRHLPVPELTATTPGGRRLRLRPPTSDDVGWITTACQDPAIPRFTQVPAPYTTAHAGAYLFDAAQRLALGQAVHLVVVDAGNGEGLGSVALFHLDDDDPAPPEIGYWIAAWARGGGVATTACATLAAWGREALGLPEIVARIAVTNTASRAVARAAGFVEAGTVPAGCHDGDEPVEEIRYRWPAPSSGTGPGTG